MKMKKKKNKKNNKKAISLASITLAFLIIICGSYFYYTYNLDKRTGEVLGEKLENFTPLCEFRRKLDALCTDEDNQNLWPVAVMIDNHPDSWPQYGLSQAQLVYNALTEGGSTRLMAVYTSPPVGEDEIEKIGPVRSARPYYLTWAKGLNALYGHSGGSPESLEKIKEYNILNWEESSAYGLEYFWRDYRYVGPHNLFTSNEKIAQARIDWGLENKIPKYQGWKFSPATPAHELVINNIYINYSLGVLFDVEYKYNTSSKLYLRWQDENPHIDALNKKQIAVKNLIIQFVPEEIRLDAEDRLAIDTIGQGEAWIFYNGQMIRAMWVKNSLEHRTMFYDKNNNQIIFRPGNIWIEVVPGNREVRIKE